MSTNAVSNSTTTTTTTNPNPENPNDKIIPTILPTVEVSSLSLPSLLSIPTFEPNYTSQLCTYTYTGTKHTYQTWYNCITCNMINSEGICSICANKCHAGHILSTPKNSHFFCD